VLPDLGSELVNGYQATLTVRAAPCLCAVSAALVCAVYAKQLPSKHHYQHQPRICVLRMSEQQRERALARSTAWQLGPATWQCNLRQYEVVEEGMVHRSAHWVFPLKPGDLPAMQAPQLLT